MYCSNCGTKVQEDAKFCPKCGQEILNDNDEEKNNQSSKNNYSKATLIGYSSKINDPKFKKYIANKKKWAYRFAYGLSAISIIGFIIYGESSSDMDNPMAALIGILIALMFLIIAWRTTSSSKKKRTWDGVVVDKKVETKTKGSDDDIATEYKVYTVVIKDDLDKKHKIRASNSPIYYNYYNIGDKVRHHGELDTYEKYDKSNDDIIFCNACGNKLSIEEDYCNICKCPLLK